LNLYTNIQTKLPFTKVLLTQTDETNDASGIVSISFKSWQLFCGLVHQARIISGVSPAFFQQFLTIESFHNFAFFRIDEEGTSLPPCSKYYCLHIAFAVEQLPIDFLRVFSCAGGNVTLKRVQSLFLPVMFFPKNFLPDSLR